MPAWRFLYAVDGFLAGVLRITCRIVYGPFDLVCLSFLLEFLVATDVPGYFF
jgi:hypothetical protein